MVIFDSNTPQTSTKNYLEKICVLLTVQHCVPKVRSYQQLAIDLEDTYTSPEPPMKSSNMYKSPKTPDSYSGNYKTPAQKPYTYGSLKPIMNSKDSYGNPVNSLDNMYVIYKTPLNAPGQDYRNRYKLIERSRSS